MRAVSGMLDHRRSRVRTRRPSRSPEALVRSLEERDARLRRFAEEQAALRRVATLVAHGTPSAEVFAAVAMEVSRVLGTDGTGLARYEPNNTFVVVAKHSEIGLGPPVGTRMNFGDGRNVAAEVWRTGKAARMDDYDDVPGEYAEAIRAYSAYPAVGAPIYVNMRLWGLIVAFTPKEANASLPADVESRLAGFTELLATAIANAQARTELVASRARMVVAADQARQRIERDLHDGTQQRLISLALGLRYAEAEVPPELPELRSRLAASADGLVSALDELREISHGIHPAVLSKEGLEAALKALARRCPIPVQLDLHVGKGLPMPVQAAAYYTSAEALTNIAKHAHATTAYIRGAVTGDHLDLSIRDDGVGGADPAGGSGLIGIIDRIEALNGTFTITSTFREGTRLDARLPVTPEY
jgi:signal transduction histidine kinase